jgi:hypothetical protein
MLNLHPEWVVLHMDAQNAFNLVFQTTIFQELWSCIDTLDQFFPFVRQFYAHPFPYYFLEASRQRDLSIISFESGT